MTRKHDDKIVVEVKERVSVPKASEGSLKSEAEEAGFDEKDLKLEEKIIDVVGKHTEDPLKEHKESEVAAKHSCGECKFYDHATEREFHRDGIRKGLVETRAICRSSKEHSTASGHLVKKESDRPCFVEGVYVAPEKPKKTEPEQKVEPKTEETSPEEAKTKGRPTHKRVDPRTAVAKNELNGQVSKLETRKDGKTFVKPLTA